jgi:hypothetical protein
VLHSYRNAQFKLNNSLTSRDIEKLTPDSDSATKIHRDFSILLFDFDGANELASERISIVHVNGTVYEKGA